MHNVAVQINDRETRAWCPSIQFYRSKYWFLWLQQQARSDWLFYCKDWALLSCNERALLARFPRHIKYNLCLTHVIQKGYPLTNVT